MRPPWSFLPLERSTCVTLSLGAGMLAACASLPDTTYLQDRDLVPPQAPTIIGARGVLPAARQDALLARLANKAGPTDMLRKHAAAEEAISGAPLVAGNQVTLLDDGPATMRAMMAAMRGARDHINLETYIFEDDQVGRA
ncbi:MAG TPA: hypothetical protein VM571_11665, partial [Noviherbaspirillum sp.]|nr:hypothetical protein [Noviherbaspirillum sp.]